MGIRAKLVFCLLAVLIPLGVVAMLALSMIEEQLTERTESALANTQRLEAARINQILESYKEDSRSLAAGNHMKHFVAGIHEYRKSKVLQGNGPTIGGYDQFAIVNKDAAWPLQQLALNLQRKAGIIGSEAVELRIVDRQGNTLGESLGFSWQPADTQLVNKSIGRVKTLFGDAFKTDSNEHRLGMISPIIGLDSVVVGALLIETRLAPITGFVSMHEGVGESTEAHIAQPTINGHAEIITPLRFDRKAAFNKIVPNSKNLAINQSLDIKGSKTIHAKDYRGVESVMSITNIPATGWGLVVKIDASEAFEPVVSLRKALSVAFAFSLLAIIVGYLFCLVPIARRLQRTAAAAHKIMNGDLTVRIHDSNTDEIGDMAQTIDTLARELEIDQKKRSEVEAQLRHQASHDELTGLLNRKHANTVIRQLNDDTDGVHSVMFLDLNGFKDVNDLYGHSAGDEVLITVARRMSNLIDDDATLARWGGDEFVVILPHTTEKEATDFALVLHNAFDNAIVTSHSVHNITCSIGLATSSAAKSLDEVLMEADILMYEQKKRHHNKHTTGSMAVRTVERALHEDRMEVWYQPIVRLQRPGNYVLSGAEATVRLRTREGGVVLAEEFREELAGTTLSTTIDRSTILSCLQTLSRWNMTGIVKENFKLSLAIDPHMLNVPEFTSVLAYQLETLHIHPKQLIFELSCLSSIEPATLAILKMLGVCLATEENNIEIDTLFSSASTRPDFTCIDHNCFIDPIDSAHLATLCQERSERTIVRNIARQEELPTLHKMGITKFQGELFDRPLKAIDFISRWGQSSLQGLGKRINQPTALRLTD